MTEIKAKKVIFKNRDGEYLLPMTEDKTGLVLFDTILKDHILTYEESKGLALQGTYVYKEAIAGERYGYPDFYNKCLEEYNNSNNTYEVLQNNYEVVGSPTITEDGVASGFSTTSYIEIPNANLQNADTWEIEGVVQIYSDSVQNEKVWLSVSSGTGIILPVALQNGSSQVQFQLYLSSNSTSWDIATNNDIRFASGSRVKCNLKFTGTQYIYTCTNLDTNEVKKVEINSSLKIYQSPTQLGLKRTATALQAGDTIDLKQFSITVDGKEVYRAVDYITTNPNGHRFYPISSKTLIDSTYEQTGMAWMYGIDQENERIFLPRNVWFEQLSIDEVGKAVEAGLPSIAHTHILPFPSDTGSGGSGTGFNQSGAKNNTYNIRTQTNTAVNAIYGKSDTVQPNAVKKLLYICVGNTVSQSTIIDVVDVTTTENDTIPFGYSTYQSNAQPSISWLKSEGQWNDGNAYITFYNWAVNKLGEAFANGHIKQVTETFDDNDLVINQDDITFRLPLLDGSEDLLNNKYTDLTLGASGDSYIAPANGWFYLSKRGEKAYEYIRMDNNTSGFSQTYHLATTSIAGKMTIPSKKGDNISVFYSVTGETEAFKFIYAQGKGSLYFKVGNAVQNLQIIDTADLIENYPTKSMVDGQWVDSFKELSSTAIVGTYTIDLSDYLPNDGYTYEVLYRIQITNNENGTNAYVNLSSDIITSVLGAAGSDNNTGGLAVYSIGVIPVRKYLTYTITATCTSAACRVLGYRRLGTNA